MFDFLKQKNCKKISSAALLKIFFMTVILGIIIVTGMGLYFWGQRTVGAQMGGISGDLANRYDAALKSQQAQLDACNKNLKVQAETNSFDRIRMGDATNILLAIQNYGFDKNGLPDNLEELSKNDYYAGNLTDPQFGAEYYYKKIDSQNYILCFYLSTGVWGTNKSKCPTKESYLSGVDATGSGSPQ